MKVRRSDMLGPRAQEQITRLGRDWKQSQHLLISGATGTGKTELARPIIDQRIMRGGHVIDFIFKHKPDETLTKVYGDFTRWTRFKKRPPSWQNKILLWPDTSKCGGNAKHILELQKEVFTEACDALNDIGNYTVVIDECFYMCNSEFLNMDQDLAMMHSIGRSNHLTMVDLMQRPSQLPLILYDSVSNAFVSRVRETTDVKRLAALGARQSAKELENVLANNDTFDFTWIKVSPGGEPEQINSRR